MPAPSTDTPSERYDLHTELGTGRTGATYRARDRHTDTEVTVKVLHPLLAASPAYVTYLHRSVDAASSFRADRLAAVREVTECAGRLSLVAEFIPGECLA